MFLYKLNYNEKCIGYRLKEVYAVKDYKTTKIDLDMSPDLAERVISEVLSKREIQGKGVLPVVKKTLQDGTVILATDNEVNVREVSTFDEAKKYIEDNRLLRKSFGKIFTIPPEGTKDEKAFTHKILDIYGIHSVRELLYCDLNLDMKIGE